MYEDAVGVEGYSKVMTTQGLLPQQEEGKISFHQSFKWIELQNKALHCSIKGGHGTITDDKCQNIPGEDRHSQNEVCLIDYQPFHRQHIKIPIYQHTYQIPDTAYNNTFLENKPISKGNQPWNAMRNTFKIFDLETWSHVSSHVLKTSFAKWGV